MTTAFVGIQNEKVVTSICKNSGGQDINDKHIKYYQETRKNLTVSRLLSLGYKIFEQNYGNIYYKNFERMNFHEARETCKKDGTSLPVPRSGRFSFDLHRDYKALTK